MKKRKESIKECVVSLRCDRETKESLEKMAASLDMSVSHLIFRLIGSGVKMEKERRVRLREICNGAEQ